MDGSDRADLATWQMQAVKAQFSDLGKRAVDERSWSELRNARLAS